MYCLSFHSLACRSTRVGVMRLAKTEPRFDSTSLCLIFVILKSYTCSASPGATGLVRTEPGFDLTSFCKICASLRDLIPVVLLDFCCFISAVV